MDRRKEAIDLIAARRIPALGTAVSRTARRLPAAHGPFLVFLVFLAAGIVVLDDYGVAWDEWTQRDIALASDRYIQGDPDALSEDTAARDYGMAFALLLLYTERLLGLEDGREILLLYHFLTHLLFLAAGLCCAQLAWQLFHSRLLAIFALLLFLLHPRLYAHSFFNAKDLPCLSMFMVALYLTERAFRKDSIPAFLLLGAAAAILTNIRIMGVMVFAAVGVLRAFDLLLASTRRERVHVLATSGAFALAGILALYATWPFLWSDPIGHFRIALEYVRVPRMSIHEIFQGTLYRPPVDELPPHYVPVWIGITTPPVTLLLFLIGVGALTVRGISRPREVLRNTTLRFGFVLIGCAVLPVLAAAVLDVPLYMAWRHLFFLYAPICLLAVHGLHRLTTLPANGYVRAGGYGLAGAGLGATLAAMIQLHPQQQTYFNFLVDRSTPGHLRTQYQIDHWGTPFRQALEWLLDRHPDASLCVQSLPKRHALRNWTILPRAERERITVNLRRKGICAPDFYLTNYRGVLNTYAPTIHTLDVYRQTITTIRGINLSLLDETTAAPYLDTYRSTLAGEPAARSRYDVHIDGSRLIYVRESCGREHVKEAFFVDFFPADARLLPDSRRTEGFVREEHYFAEIGVRFDGRCMAVVSLPEYRLSRLSTGQWSRKRGQVWAAEVPVAGGGPDPE